MNVLVTHLIGENNPGLKSLTDCIRSPGLSLPTPDLKGEFTQN